MHIHQNISNGSKHRPEFQRRGQLEKKTELSVTTNLKYSLPKPWGRGGLASLTGACCRLFHGASQNQRKSSLGFTDSKMPQLISSEFRCSVLAFQIGQGDACP